MVLSRERRTLHEGGGFVVERNAGRPGSMFAPTTVGELLVRICAITDSVRGPGDALKAVLAIKEEVDRWEVKAFNQAPQAYKGQTIIGPGGVRWTWDGAAWIEER